MSYVLEPEVAGGLGDGTVMDTSVHPPRVQRLEYRFDGWLGDDMLESFPCFVVTDRLKTAIQQADLSGESFAPVDVTKSETFDELYPDRDLPSFAWLQVNGKAGADDWGLAPDHRLVVSERAYGLLQQFRIDTSLVEPYTP